MVFDLILYTFDPGVQLGLRGSPETKTDCHRKSIIRNIHFITVIIRNRAVTHYTENQNIVLEDPWFIKDL